MKVMFNKIEFKPGRWLTHLALALFSLISCLLTFGYSPTSALNEVLSLGTGYVALLLLALSLLIGPFNLLRKRRNPVNLDLRRDIGIWAGIDGLVHVWFSLQLYNNGDILSYFFARESQPDATLFSLSNFVGLVATLVLVVLLVTSNQLSLRWLKGKRWKLVQRFNYPLAALVLLHTFGYQVLNQRESVFSLSVIVLSLFVLVVQLGGMVIFIKRAELRQSVDKSPAVPAPVVAGQPGLARRQFLLLGGAALLTGSGFAAGLIWGRSTSASSDAPSSPVVAQKPDFGSGPTVTQTPEFATTPVANLATATPAAQATSIAAPTTSVPTTTKPAATATQPATTSSRSPVLANLSSLAVGTAIKFTTPDTKESAFLVHTNDGAVKAYSGICTHRPYNLVFNSSQQTLVCNLHRVAFDLSNGAPESRPATTPLQSFKVQVDAQGNVVYAQA